MVTLNQVKLNKKIGEGLLGSVYLANAKNNNKKEYAIKIEPILASEIKQNYRYSFWREVEFANTMSKYPLHFMKLYDYKITKDDDYKIKLDKKKILHSSISEKNYYKRLLNSEYRVVKLYSFVDTTLNKVLKSWKVFDKVLFYDLFIQIVYAIYLMDKEGYVHRDLHFKNIGINFTQKKTLNIFGKKIPTHGMCVVILDYGEVLHKKYILSGSEKQIIAYENDLFVVLNFVYDFEDFIKYYQKELGSIEYRSPVKINAKYEKLLNDYIKNLSIDKTRKDWLMSILFKIVYFHQYERDILDGAKVNDEGRHYFEPRYYIPIETIIFAIENIYNIDKIVRYLIKNRE